MCTETHSAWLTIKARSTPTSRGCERGKDVYAPGVRHDPSVVLGKPFPRDSVSLSVKVSSRRCRAGGMECKTRRAAVATVSPASRRGWRWGRRLVFAEVVAGSSGGRVRAAVLPADDPPAPSHLYPSTLLQAHAHPAHPVSRGAGFPTPHPAPPTCSAAPRSRSPSRISSSR